MNNLDEYANVFHSVTPWAGVVPSGHGVDFLGTLTDVTFDPRWRGDGPWFGERFIQTSLPILDNMKNSDSPSIIDWSGERWFEAVNWFVAAAEARNSFVMITLGAWHGSQAVGCHQALRRVNPIPAKFVAVEPVPENIELTKQHFRDNGIDPNAHWLIPMAVSDRNDPVLFAIGPRGMGPQNCYSTNEVPARRHYYQQLISCGKSEQALEELLLRNSTGITVSGKILVPGDDFKAEIKYVSAITLSEVLGPFERVDYLESDIQQSEILAFPPFMDLLKTKVRRIHIGTHGKDVHGTLCELFARAKWELVFNYEPDCVHETVLGTFKNDDGVLTVRNPNL
jgi:FkbM family methyltransferase